MQNALVALSIGEKIKEAVGFLGAGIYEELLFRLILLSLLAWAFRRAGTTPRMSMILAVIFSSLLFAAAHYVGPYGETIPLVPLPVSLFGGGIFCGRVHLSRIRHRRGQPRRVRYPGVALGLTSSPRFSLTLLRERNVGEPPW